MDTITDEKHSEGAEKSPEKWLNIIADLQGENRSLRAQLSVVRGLVIAASNTATLWDSEGEPCWCGTGDEAFRAPHSDICLQLRRIVRSLLEGLQEVGP